MAGSLHGSARTTPRVRAELQASKEATGTLAQRYGLSRTTVTKWRARTTTDDAPMGPSSRHSTVLTLAEEAMVVEFRRRTLLPLDDVLGCLCDSIPKLTRSSLHRCLERHAARMAVGAGADVTILDRSLRRLRELDDLFGGRAKTRFSSLAALEEEVLAADVVVGAVLVPGATAPKLVRREMLRAMKRGAVIVDVAIDQGAALKPRSHDACGPNLCSGWRNPLLRA